MFGFGFVWVWHWADLRAVVRWGAESCGMRKEEISLIVEHQKGVFFWNCKAFCKNPLSQGI